MGAPMWVTGSDKEVELITVRSAESWLWSWCGWQEEGLGEAFFSQKPTHLGVAMARAQ